MMSARHDLLLAVGVHVLGLVEAAHVAVEDAPELQGERALSLGQGRVEAQLQDVGCGVVGDLHALAALARRGRGEGGRLDVDLLEVHGDLGQARLGDSHGDLLVAVVLELLEIRTQIQVVVGGHHALGQNHSLAHRAGLGVEKWAGGRNASEMTDAMPEPRSFPLLSCDQSDRAPQKKSILARSLPNS
jgi:hypothetical protein